MPSMGRRLVAEALGTFALVFVGAAVVVVNGGFPNSGIGLLGIALAHAVVLSVMISATMAISGGHLLPGQQPRLGSADSQPGSAGPGLRSDPRHWSGSGPRT